MKNFFKKSHIIFKEKMLYPYIDLVETFPSFFAIFVLGLTGMILVLLFLFIILEILFFLSYITLYAIPILLILGLAFAAGWLLKIILIDYKNDRK